MTFIDLQTRVKNRVIDLPPAVQTEVPALINEAIRTMQRKYNFRAMEGSTVLVTSTGTLIPTPNTILNFKEYMDKGPYLQKFLTRSRRFITATPADASMAIFADTTVPTEPQYLTSAVDPTTGAVTFSYFPYADLNSDWSDGNYRIVVPYYAFSPKLVNDSDTNWFVQNADDFIIREATGQAFALDWDYNSMALWLQQAEVKRMEVVKADKMSRLAGVNELVPMWQGANQPQVRR